MLLITLVGALLLVSSDHRGCHRLVHPSPIAPSNHQSRYHDTVGYTTASIGDGDRCYILHDVRDIGGSDRHESCKSLEDFYFCYLSFYTSSPWLNLAGSHAFFFSIHMYAGRGIGRLSSRLISLHNFSPGGVKNKKYPILI